MNTPEMVENITKAIAGITLPRGYTGVQVRIVRKALQVVIIPAAKNPYPIAELIWFSFGPSWHVETGFSEITQVAIAASGVS